MSPMDTQIRRKLENAKMEPPQMFLSATEKFETQTACGQDFSDNYTLNQTDCFTPNTLLGTFLLLVYHSNITKTKQLCMVHAQSSCDSSDCITNIIGGFLEG